jgi:hypothetical protein
VLVAGYVVAACGGGSPAGKQAAVLARLSVFDQRVDIATGAGVSASVGKSGKALVVGDVVRTDAHGFGEIDYTEGSLVRLDSGTSYVVTKLVRSGGVQQTTARLDVGRSWHSVKKLSGSESAYEVETPNAVAAVQGTVFMVDCRTSTCVFTVVEGVVSVRVKYAGTVRVAAGQSLSVPPPAAAGAPAPLLIPGAADLARDAFALRNHNIDTGTGSSPTAAPAGTDDRIDGTYDVTFTVVSRTGYLALGQRAKVEHRSWRLSPCSGAPCSVDVTSSSGFRGKASFDGSVLTLPFTSTTDAQCIDRTTNRPASGRTSISLTGTHTVVVTRRTSTDPFAPGAALRLEGRSVQDAVATGRLGCSTESGRLIESVVVVRH